MTPLQIFASIFITACILGWVILVNACKNAPYENKGDEIIYTDETHFD